MPICVCVWRACLKLESLKLLALPRQMTRNLEELKMTTKRTKATVAEVSASGLFYAVEGKTFEPIKPICEVGTGRVVVRTPLMLDELEVVDFASIGGEVRRGRFLQAADVLNPVPKTIFVFPPE